MRTTVIHSRSIVRAAHWNTLRRPMARRCSAAATCFFRIRRKKLRRSYFSNRGKTVRSPFWHAGSSAEHSGVFAMSVIRKRWRWRVHCRPLLRTWFLRCFSLLRLRFVIRSALWRAYWMISSRRWRRFPTVCPRFRSCTIAATAIAAKPSAGSRIPFRWIRRIR